MNTKHKMTFSGFQTSQPREEKLNPESNLSAVSWSGLFWYEVLNYLCGTSLQCIIWRDKQIPFAAYTQRFQGTFYQQR